MITVRLNELPQGKGRPRRGKHGAVYTPAETRAYEERLAWAARLAMRGQQLLTGPVVVTVLACFVPPASWSLRKQRAALAGREHPTGRPDLDNIVKAGLDALNGICWADDAAVVEIRARKIYSTAPSLLIRAWAMSEVDPATEVPA